MAAAPLHLLQRQYVLRSTYYTYDKSARTFGLEKSDSDLADAARAYPSLSVPFLLGFNFYSFFCLATNKDNHRMTPLISLYFSLDLKYSMTKPKARNEGMMRSHHHGVVGWQVATRTLGGV